jgi:RecT family
MNMATQIEQQASAPDLVAAEAAELAKDRELRRSERQALTAIPSSDLAISPLRTSFIPQSMGEAMQLATIMSRSTFVPKHCRGSEGNCLAIIMQASRWGMDPFAVANKAYFVKDDAPPAFESQLVNAVVNSSGALSGRLRIESEGEGETLRCTVRGFLRADPSDEKVKTQSIARISVRNSPLWKSDPDQQLAYYTTRAWARLHCPEVLLGVYTPDELDIDPERARIISAPMPRRSDYAAQPEDEETARDLDAQAAAAERGLSDDEQVDQETGEVTSGQNDTVSRQSSRADAPSAEPAGENPSGQQGGQREGPSHDEEMPVSDFDMAICDIQNATMIPDVNSRVSRHMTNNAFSEDQCADLRMAGVERIEQLKESAK